MKGFNFFSLVLLLALPTTVFGQSERSSLPDSLIAYYPLGDTISSLGTVADSSGNGFNAFIGDQSLPKYSKDKYDIDSMAYEFDYLDFIQFPSTDSMAITDTLMMSLWFNPSEDRDGNIISNRVDNFNIEERGDFLLKQEGDSLTYTYWDADDVFQLVVIDNLFSTLNKWYHLLVLHTPTTVSITVNGIEVVNKAATYTFTKNMHPIILGNIPGSPNIEGLVDDIAFGRDVLSSADIVKLYKNYNEVDTFSGTTTDESITRLRWSSERINTMQIYYVYRDGELHDSVSVSSANDTTFTDIGLTNGQGYTYFIQVKVHLEILVTPQIHFQ